VQIQIHTDRNIEGGERFSGYAEGYVEDVLGRFSDHITSVQVHLSDENGDKNNGGNDKRCLMEAHRAGRNPVIASHHAGTIEEALHGAGEKLKRMFNDTAVSHGR
jgi:ribosome-associated translation inhibitor RaiA